MGVFDQSRVAHASRSWNTHCVLWMLWASPGARRISVHCNACFNNFAASQNALGVLGSAPLVLSQASLVLVAACQGKEPKGKGMSAGMAAKQSDEMLSTTACLVSELEGHDVCIVVFVVLAFHLYTSITDGISSSFRWMQACWSR